MICPKCRHANPDGVKFCNECGYRFQDHAQQATRETHLFVPSGERRVATVLFADLKGFTSFSEDRDPEEVREIIDPLFSRFREEITTRGGHVDKFIGDAVMAIFGAPEAHEDDASRAIDAAFALHETLQCFNQAQVKTGGANLQIRVGINTGEVLWGSLGGDRATVVGDAVNVAQRLESITPPGTTMVGRTTQKLAGGHFLYQAQDPVLVKGRSEAVEPFLVTGKGALAYALQGFRAANIPMVGRKRELDRLVHIFEQVIASGRPHWVLVTGEAGVGKSRLVNEFIYLLSQRREQALTLVGRCLPYGGSPLHPVREIMRQYVSLRVLKGKFVPGMGAAHDPGFVQEVVERIKRDLAVPGRYSPLTLENMAHLLCLSILEMSIPDARVAHLGPKERHDALRNALCTWLAALGRNYPAVLVFEDMQWSDATTREVTEHFLNLTSEGLFGGPPTSLSGRGLLVLALARSGIRERWSFTQAWPSDTLSLDTLSATQVAQLTQLSLKGKLPAGIADFIARQSGGNPLYSEELIRYLLEADILTPGPAGKAPGWRLAPGVSLAGNVPMTLNGVLGARVDTLPANTRQVLSQASVIGQTFWERLIERMVRRVVHRELETLEQRDLVYGQSASELENDHEYVFKHALMREVVYSRLTHKDRKQMHRLVADILSSMRGEKTRSTLLALIAWHQAEAGALAEARHSYSQAGEQAFAEGMPEDAVGYLDEAIALCEPVQDPSCIELRVRRADANRLIGRLEAAAADYREAIAAAADERTLARCTRMLAIVHDIQGDAPAARKTFKQALEFAAAYPLERVRILCRLAFLEAVTGNNYDEAERLVLRAHDLILSQYPELKLPAAEGHGQNTQPIPDRVRAVFADTLHYCAVVFKERHDLEQALDFAKQSLALSEAMDNKLGVMNAANDLGLVYHYQGDLDQALAYYRQSLATCEAIGHKRGIAAASSNIAMIFRLRGELDRALVYLQRDLAISEEFGARHGIMCAYGNMGIVYETRGDMDRALACYQEALAMSKAIGTRQGIAKALRRIAGIQLKRGAPDQALENLRQSLAICEAIGDKQGSSIVLDTIGAVYLAQDDTNRALTAYQRALALITEIGDKANIGVTSGEIGNVYLVREELDQALEWYQKSLGILEEVGQQQNIAHVSGNIGHVLHMRGELDRALAWFRRHLAISEKGAFQLDIMAASANLGRAYHDLGDLEQARMYHQKRLSISRELGDKEKQAQAILDLAKVYCSLDAYDRALKLAQDAHSLFSKTHNGQGAGDCKCLQADIECRAGNLPAAGSCLKKAKEAYKAHGQGPYAWRVPLVGLRLAIANALAAQDPRQYAQQKDLAARSQSLVNEARGSRRMAFVIEAGLLQGRALHLLGRTADAESAWQQALERARLKGFGLLKRRIAHCMDGNTGAG